MDTHHRHGFRPGGVIFCAFFTIVAISFAGTYSGGAGTAEDPYRISTLEDWRTLTKTSTDWDNSFILTTDLDLEGEYYYQAPIAPDTDATAYGFQGTLFTGTFDGKGHIIHKLFIYALAKDCIGLFGNIAYPTQLQNIQLEDMDIRGRKFTGGLCGINDYGTISQCHVTGKVTGVSCVGGLCGVYSGYNTGIISNCSASVIAIGGQDVGGLCGNHAYGPITQCFSSGSVTGTDDPWTASLGVGGLCGENEHGTISESFSTSTVKGEYYVGGLCGQNWGTIDLCYATGEVQGEDRVGGLCGFNNSKGTIHQSFSTGCVTPIGVYVGGLCGVNAGTINACFWDIQTSGLTTSDGGEGKTTAEMKTQAIFTSAGWDFVGVWMICEGKSYPHFIREKYACPPPDYSGAGTAEDPYKISTVGHWQKLIATSADWDKNFILLNDIDFSGAAITPVGNDVTKFNGVLDGAGHTLSNFVIHQPNSGYVGLFGYVWNGQVKDLGVVNANIAGQNCVGGLAGFFAGTITSCYATGVVTGSDYHVGGLAGFFAGTITSCYATGTITGNGDNVGGLVGLFFGPMMTSCYSAGPVTGNGDNAGGLVGSRFSKAIINGCFWDMETTGQNASAGGTGKSTAEMKTQVTFTNAGWDFANIWAICEGTNYPRLKWQVPVTDWVCPDGVALEDLVYLAGRWMKTTSTGAGAADADGNGKVDLSDFEILAEQWMR